jgi:hypothetical protein
MLEKIKNYLNIISKNVRRKKKYFYIKIILRKPKAGSFGIS